MGKRYTREEISQIQSLISDGLTTREIATRLGRPEAGIRNLRHRTKLKAETRETIESLKRERRTLNQHVQDLRWELSTLQTKKQDIYPRPSTPKNKPSTKNCTTLSRQ